MEYSVDSSGKETLKSQLDIIEKGLDKSLVHQYQYQIRMVQNSELNGLI